MKRVQKRKDSRKNRRRLPTAAAAVLATVLMCLPVYGTEPSGTEQSLSGDPSLSGIFPEGEQSLTENPAAERESETTTAGWRKVEDLWYYYDGEGRMQTGWIQAEDGLWYQLDSEKGNWVSRPVLNTEAAVHLLENAIKKQGYYQNEQQPVVVREDGRNESLIYMSVRIVTGPNDDQIINNYEVNKKSGRVKAAAGGSFNLYD